MLIREFVPFLYPAIYHKWVEIIAYHWDLKISVKSIVSVHPQSKDSSEVRAQQFCSSKVPTDLPILVSCSQNCFIAIFNIKS